MVQTSQPNKLVIARGAFFACALAFTACSAQSTDSSGGSNTPFTAGATPIVTQGADPGKPCPGDNVTQPCVCQVNGKTSAGRQTCNSATGWGTCECAAALVATSNGGITGPISNKSSVNFKWEETTPSVSNGTIVGGTCKGGHYSGAFSGFYNSPRMSQTGTDTMSPVGIPVLGNVEFDLHQIGNGEYFEIRDGAMEGYALVVFPFRGDLVGTINCAAAEPLIEVSLKNGTYLAIDIQYYFDGKAVGVYHKPDANNPEASFDLGEWAVTEPEDYSVVTRYDGGTADLSQAKYAPLPELKPGESPILDMFIEGGTGEWNAIWAGPETGVGANPGP
jgi:hypothetical protein